METKRIKKTGRRSNSFISNKWQKELSDRDLHIVANKRVMVEIFKETLFRDFIDFENKIVVDYGCGGGQLIRPIFYGKKIKKYIGLDIAQRAIDFIKEEYYYINLIELIKIKPWDFMKAVKDEQKHIFICQYCIQHFISKKYLDGFLAELNNQKYEWIILNYRNNDETKFRESPYGSLRDVIYACLTNSFYISEKLTNYKFYSRLNLESKKMECAYWHYDK